MASVLQTIREGGTQHPEEMLHFLQNRLISTSGVFDINSSYFKVEQSDTPAMTVDVKQGYAFIRKDADITYPVWLNTEDATVSISSNATGNSRIDAIVLYINLGASPNATVGNVATLTAVEGTAAASPVAPDATAIQADIGASNPYIVLAYVTVESGETTILTADITDKRTEVIFSEVPRFHSGSMFENAIINGNFDVSQRATTFVAGANNDDVYTLDRWNLISDGNDAADISQSAITDLPGSNYAYKLDVETAKRSGLVQFLEAKDAQKYKGKYVSVSFAVKSANIAAIRCAVLSWGSTADVLTSDIVSSWAATPTWAANWTAENTPADLTVTSSWTTVKVENIYIDSATVNNLALAIWLPNEETIGDIIYISQVKMNEGSRVLPFQPKSYAEELRACQRYCQVNTHGVQYQSYAIGLNTTATTGLYTYFFKTSMRSAAALTLVTTGTFNVVYGGGGSFVGSASITIGQVGVDTCNLTATVAGGLPTPAVSMLADAGNDSSLIFSSEL